MSSEFQNNTKPDADAPKASPQLFDRWSLTSKIITWYTIFLSAILILLSIFIFQFTQRWEMNDLNTRLESTSITMANDLDLFQPYQKGSFFILYSQEGLILKGALPDAFPKQTIMSPNKIAEITVNDMTYYYYDTPVHDKAGLNGWVRGITPIRNVTSRTANMLYTLLFGAIIFLIIATFGGYILIKRSLKPVRIITQTAAEITNSKNLSRRLTPTGSGDDELSDLTSTLNRMFKSLEDASNRERQFSSDVSHEIRTPIAVIQAEADFGRKHIKTLEEAKESFSNIYQKSRFTSELISQLLDLARLDQADNLTKETIDISTMLQSLAHDYRRICESHTIQFISKIEPNLHVHGHQAGLQRAIGNFLDNAVKFTQDSITLSGSSTKDAIIISVSDNGIGIPKEDLQKIWDRLYQVDSSRSHNKNKGVGIGLYFVQRIASLHQAQVDVHSEPHKNTTFSLIIPKDPK